ncbi:GntR family transcriptional regulator [Microbacterium karelineae]|uniref:GntR family transcriptional regulator n=1 Tax=Microbacterium karelineae TaxID=2654283 RepID=UPI0012EAB568|nr:GntR family transcriptional regulator [Microbacterium karelineae]
MSGDWLAPIERRFHAERAHVSDSVVDSLVARIRGGSLRQGDQINTVELAREHGVARASVREAVFRLERVGVVVAEAGRYTRIADVTSDLVSWVSEAAAHDLAFAAKRGAPDLDATARARARELAESISDCMGWSEAVSGPGLELGQLFADAHPNALHRTRVRELAPAIAYFLGAAKVRPHIDLDDVAGRLVEAINAGDGPAAAGAMRRLYTP